MIHIAATLQWQLQKLPLPLEPLDPIYGSVDPPESSSKTASRSVQSFSYESPMLCCTMHCCQLGRKPPKLFRLGFRHPAGGRPRHGDRQYAQKLGKYCACGSGYMLAERQTDRHVHTDALITILRHRSRGQSKINVYANDCQCLESKNVACNAFCVLLWRLECLSSVSNSCYNFNWIKTTVRLITSAH